MTDRQDHKDRATEIVNEWCGEKQQRTSVLVERITDALQSAHRAGKVAGMREAARECERRAPFQPGRFDPDERVHERCADRCAAAIRALAAKEEA